MSISIISRFACTNVWFVCVFTNSICVTFTGVCFAFVNICHTKKGEKEKRMADQPFVCPVEQWRQNIDCTFTVVSISIISRFACANVRSVCVVTNSICVTFTGVCFAFVNICQKKKEKREKNGWPTLCVPVWVVEAKYWLSVFVEKKRKKREKTKNRI